jgi:hypothetical protein
MNAKELRIGNLVYHNDKIIEIKSLHPQDDDVNDEIPFHAIYGINLTEEWLEKLGFELKGFYRLKVTSFLELCWKPHDKTLNMQTENNGFTEDSKVKYVHELQNLYFALTGKELVVFDAVT